MGDKMRLRISPLLSSGMVLQQGVAVPIKGEAPPETEITATFRGNVYRARAEGASSGSGASSRCGEWRLLLDSQIAGGPYTMEISAEIPAETEKAKIETIIIDDIYVGDVWLCSGQSNMELPMRRLKDDFPEEWEPPVNSLIRQFTVPQEWDFSGPRQALTAGRWMAAAAGEAGPEILEEFYGTAWFFANALYEKHKTPVGLITAAWGGTPAEAWMSREALAGAAGAAGPEKIAAGDQYANPELCDTIARENETAVKAWEDAVAAADLGSVRSSHNAADTAGAWYSPETDIAEWDDILLPGPFATDKLTDFCGVLWLAKDVEVPESFATQNAKIWLGTIVDADTVYINGTEVGTTGYRYPPRKYPVPAGLLHKGKNRVVIRVVCNNGQGGITFGKPFRIFTGSETIELEGPWKYKVGAAAPPRPDEFFFQRQPMGLFNAMIAPVLDYPCKGIIWYQGEANDKNPHEYAALFTALINDWRAKSKSPLPFLFVQLPIWGSPVDDSESSSWALIREAQLSALSLPMTGMAAALDLGEWNDLHPINKKDVGRRLALAAEKVVYGQHNTSPGPLLRTVERRGDKLVFTFDNCGDGIKEDLTQRRKDAKVSIIADGQVYRLPVNIEGTDSISVDISTIENPQKALYAWAGNPCGGLLFNSDGLPMIPFRVGIK